MSCQLVKVVQEIPETSYCANKEQGAYLTLHTTLMQQKLFGGMSEEEKSDSIMIHKHILDCCFCNKLYDNAKLCLLRGFNGDREYLEILEDNENILNFLAQFYHPN